jgi:myo-inositol-1(or 4)-monophosphatase
MDFATEADLRAEETIRAHLRSARPDDAFLGEEGGYDGDPAATRTWLVDPLCGTLNFAARTPLMAVNVALRQGVEVTAAAAADPCADEVFWTDGVTVGVRRGGTDEPLVPSPGSRLVDVNIDRGLLDPEDDLAVRLLGGLRAWFGTRVLSSTLPLAWVAAGRRAAYVTGGRLRDSVHFAAGIALCRAAGCTVTGLRGEPLHTGVEGLVAAADEETHRAIVATVERLAR